LIAREDEGKSEGTIRFYRDKLRVFYQYCEAQAVNQIPKITPRVIREYLPCLEDTGQTPGGRHAYYRAFRAFLYFYENEAEPQDWRNPIKKVKAPTVPKEPLRTA